MATVQTLCSNTVDLSLTTPQSIWTTRILPIGNAVITGAVMRDTSGINLSGNNTVFINVVVQGSSTGYQFTMIDSYNSPAGPRFSVGQPAGAFSATLTANPVVTASVSTFLPTTGTVTIDLLGYYI